MADLVERVARAIFEDFYRVRWEDASDFRRGIGFSMARAAIAAFLRAPGVWSAIMEDYEAVTAAVEAEEME